MTLGKFSESADYFERSLAADPLLAATHFFQGANFSSLERFTDALAAFARAAELGLDSADLHHNRGIALFGLAQPEAALQSIERALVSGGTQNLGLIFNTQGFVLQSLARPQEALAAYQQALTLDPAIEIARLNLALVSLMLGQWAAGWEGYEARWAGSHEGKQGSFRRPASELPQWNGEPVAAPDGLLVFAEQGLGDAIQFARYLDLAAQRFKRVSLTCPASLLRLFKASFSERVEILDARPVDHRAWQWQTPLLSLPRAFKTTLDNLPATVPYLHAPPDLQEKWRRRLASLRGGRLAVGLVWAGAASLRLDAQRSIALEKFSGLLSCQGILMVSLQKGETSWQQERLGSNAGLVDWSDELVDFAETAALLNNLDLVIAVDTAVAHLAGALGKPVWLLNRFASEWRWLHGREDSPWYPSMRIFNQVTPGDWDDVLSRLLLALSEKSAQFSG